MSNPNPFEKLAELEEKQEQTIKAPPHLRHKVLGTYHLVTGVLKVFELFLSNAVNTALNMVSLVSDQTECKEQTGSTTTSDHLVQYLETSKQTTISQQDCSIDVEESILFKQLKEDVDKTKREDIN